MQIHPIQSKLLGVISRINIKKMSLRDIALLVDESHPQKIRHHLAQLEKKGLIEIDKRTGIVKRMNQGLRNKESVIAVPVYGCADCGEATVYADQNLEGYLRVSRSLIGAVKNIFAVKAQGPSMNKAKVNGQFSIDEGDYVLVDPDNRNPKTGDYVLSVINEAANIKKFIWDSKTKQIALVSESTENIKPIFIHEDDNYMINGIVKNVVKTSAFKELSAMQDAAGKDALNVLGSMSQDEASYYRNLK